MKKYISIIIVLAITWSHLHGSYSIVRSNKIIVPIKAGDFKDCSYLDNYDCALARAVKRYYRDNGIQFTSVLVGAESVQIYIGYSMVANFEIKNGYGCGDYNYDEMFSSWRNPNHIERDVELIVNKNK